MLEKPGRQNSDGGKDGRLFSAGTGAAGPNRGRAKGSSFSIPIPLSLESKRQLIHPWYAVWWLGTGSGDR